MFRVVLLLHLNWKICYKCRGGRQLIGRPRLALLFIHFVRHYRVRLYTHLCILCLIYAKFTWPQLLGERLITKSIKTELANKANGYGRTAPTIHSLGTRAGLCQSGVFSLCALRCTSFKNAGENWKGIFQGKPKKQTQWKGKGLLQGRGRNRVGKREGKTMQPKSSGKTIIPFVQLMTGLGSNQIVYTFICIKGL